MIKKRIYGLLREFKGPINILSFPEKDRVSKEIKKETFIKKGEACCS